MLLPRLQPDQANASKSLREIIADFGKDNSKVSQLCSGLDLLDLNHALFKCDDEERSDGHGGGVYSLDGYGPLKYAGLQGVMSLLSEIRPKNDMGNWLPNNLRNGNWLMVRKIIHVLMSDESR